jgi:hypothetical protein
MAEQMTFTFAEVNEFIIQIREKFSTIIDDLPAKKKRKWRDEINNFLTVNMICPIINKYRRSR